ncbi:unnamed protein product [Lepeophtheirus salmonis]|uniref:(salmon louse) hypothetical protein n=1 Tax=Lepeophtheirus salmonis TaxID=72036 RepID=A0A7R8CJE6_LEPSM|nr:unnamed protein product [Lepeophtheirus salmonis]CAF2810516.1 unnamed protein product [Lepeophtheirus salmonis]
MVLSMLREPPAIKPVKLTNGLNMPNGIAFSFNDAATVAQRHGMKRKIVMQMVVLVPIAKREDSTESCVETKAESML